LKKLCNQIGELIRHNVPLTITICLVAGILIWLGGCESHTLSLTLPGVKVTRPELKIEYDSEMARFEQGLAKLQATTLLREQDLDRQDAFKQKLFEIGKAWSETGEVNPIGVATSLLALLFGGSFMNGLVKDRIIKTQNNGINQGGNGALPA